MWFKTRMGIIHIEGFFQISVGGAYSIAGVAYRAITAKRPETSMAPRGTVKSLWGGTLNFPSAGDYTLATFVDDENIDGSISKCMGIILDAIKNNESVCNLSEQGTRGGWNEKWLEIKWAS